MKSESSKSESQAFNDNELEEIMSEIEELEGAKDSENKVKMKEEEEEAPEEENENILAGDIAAVVDVKMEEGSCVKISEEISETAEYIEPSSGPSVSFDHENMDKFKIDLTLNHNVSIDLYFQFSNEKINLQLDDSQNIIFNLPSGVKLKYSIKDNLSKL